MYDVVYCFLQKVRYFPSLIKINDSQKTIFQKSICTGLDTNYNNLQGSSPLYKGPLHRYKAYTAYMSVFYRMHCEHNSMKVHIEHV
jgi:hypothetical protein